MNTPLRRVIVVDDDPDLLHLATLRLRRRGFEAITATNGVEALHRMVEHPDCRELITDFHMPVLGEDPWIRVLERFCSDWRVVVLSAHDVDPGPFLAFPKPPDFDNITAYFLQDPEHTR